MKIKIVGMVILTLFIPLGQTASFNKAKQNLYTKVHPNEGTTVYCGCKWKNRKVDLSSCGLQSFFPKKQKKRARRTEAEHIIPASWFLKKNKKYRECATESKKHKESARKYCQKHDLEYKKAHNDLSNLFVSVGQINADRSNKPYLETIKQKKRTYGQCSISVGSRGFVPPINMQGDIARVAFYMRDTYGVTYSTRQSKLFIKWNKSDPVSEVERKRNRAIVKIQGYGIHQ